MTDKAIFYCGIILVIFVVIFGVIYFCIHKINMRRLIKKLENEYGKMEKRPNSKR